MRKIQFSDAEAIFGMRNNQRVNQFIGRARMVDPEQAHELMDKVENAYGNKEGLAWAGILRDQGSIVGTCGFNRFEWENKRAEIGGELATEYWGKGIPVEAVQAIVNFGFEGLGLQAIEAKVSPDNRGAIFLLTHLGFQKEAHFENRYLFQGEFYDLAVYTLQKPD